jgi:hypothetical protein
MGLKTKPSLGGRPPLDDKALEGIAFVLDSAPFPAKDRP